jgi:hypothetical protein
MNTTQTLITHERHVRAKFTSIPKLLHPTHFFIGRPKDSPYAWSYDDDTMRASNILWLTEEVVDGKELDKVYLEEIIRISVSKVARRVRERERKGKVKKRRVGDDEIVDLTVSGSDEEIVEEGNPITPTRSSGRKSRNGLTSSRGYRGRTKSNPIHSSPLGRYSSTPSSYSTQSSSLSQTTSYDLTTSQSCSTDSDQVAPTMLTGRNDREGSKRSRAELRAIFVRMTMRYFG